MNTRKPRAGLTSNPLAIATPSKNVCSNNPTNADALTAAVEPKGAARFPTARTTNHVLRTAATRCSREMASPARGAGDDATTRPCSRISIRSSRSRSGLSEARAVIEIDAPEATRTSSPMPAPFNDIDLTMGHWHIVSKDLEANKKLFLAMGGTLYMPGGNALVMFPGVYVNLVLQNQKGDGGTEGSVVNHVGFIVDNVQQRVAQWKAAGVAVLPGNNGRLDQAFVVTPDGVRMEILEDKTQGVPIRHEHVHLSVPASEVPKAQAWYAKTFGGKAGLRNKAPIVDAPGVQIRFATADAKQAPTRGRVLDHIGFDVKDINAMARKLEADGIKLDEPVRKSPTGSTITYITDPWGTRIEIVQRAPLGPQVQSTQ